MKHNDMVDWQKIQTVFLDMDGTLLDLHFDIYFWFEHVPQKYSEVHSVPCEQARDKLVKLFELHRGSMNWYCLDFWSQLLSLDIVTLKAEVRHKIAFRPNVLNFLQKLIDHKKKIIIVTDAHHDSIKLKFETTALHEWVDGVICSHDFNRPKQDPDFWLALHKEKPIDLETTLFIDDSLPVLRSAQAYGFKHLFLISQPDSQRPCQDNNEFPAIGDFLEISPGRPVTVAHESND